MENNKQFAVLNTILLHQLHLARKQADAIYFVINAKDNMDKIRDEIEKMSLRSSANNETILGQEEELELIYLLRLQEGLEFVQSELQKRGHYTEQITGLLGKLVVPHDAAGDAYQFVLDSNLNIDLLVNEIQEIEDIIINPPESLIGAMHPGATPGIYKRSYLKTLQEIVELIKNKERPNN